MVLGILSNKFWLKSNLVNFSNFDREFGNVSTLFFLRFNDVRFVNFDIDSGIWLILLYAKDKLLRNLNFDMVSGIRKRLHFSNFNPTTRLLCDTKKTFSGRIRSSRSIEIGLISHLVKYSKSLIKSASSSTILTPLNSITFPEISITLNRMIYN